MNKNFKLILTMILAVGLIVNFMQMVVYANNQEDILLETRGIRSVSNIASGSLGTSAWRITSDGTLYIGAGELAASNNNSYYQPWYSRRDIITKIVFEGDVTTEVGSQSYLFSRLDKVTTIEGLNRFDTSKVTDMSWMFSSMEALTELDVSSFNTSNVTDMGGMFNGLYVLTELDISSFDTSKVINMSRMFSRMPLTKLDVSNFVTSKVNNMTMMFNNLPVLTELDVSNFDTSEVTNMMAMFYDMPALTKLDVSNFDTSEVANMSWMFSDLPVLTELDVSNFATSKVINMSGMFDGMNSLTKLDLSNFNTNGTNISSMLGGLYSLRELILGEGVVSLGNSSLDDIMSVLGYPEPEATPYTGFWQNIGSGRVENPLGEHVLTTAELMAQYGGSTMADTYVWQPKMTARRFITNVLSFGNGSAYASKTESIARGETITLTAEESGDEIFKGWFVVEGDITLSSFSEANVTFVNNGEDVEVIAVFGRDNGSLKGEHLYTSNNIEVMLSDVISWGENDTLYHEIIERVDVRRYNILNGTTYERYSDVFCSQIEAVAGIYVVDFSVDSIDNPVVLTSSIVTVVDDVAPVITVQNENITLSAGEERPSSWSELFGVSAEDETDGDVTGKIAYNMETTEIDMNVAEAYTIVAGVMDEAGNESTKMLYFIIEALALEVEEPEIEEPEIEGPEIEGPEIEGPEIEGPEMEEPEIEGPEIEEPEIEGPEVEEPEIEGPEVDEPEVEDSKIDDSKVDDLEVEDSKIDDLEVEDSKVEAPELENQKVADSEVKDLAIEKPVVKNLAIRKLIVGEAVNASSKAITVPRTGDSANLFGLCGLFSVSFGAMLVLAIRKKNF